MSVFCQAVVYLLVALPAVAQSQAFATITIKPARSADPRTARVQVLPNGDLIASAVPVITLLSYAYDVPVNPSPRLSALPDWTVRERYDIEGKAPANAITPSLLDSEARSRIQLMFRALLADRFRLVMRVENKTMSVYALTVASGGSKLQKSAITNKDCTFDTDPEGCHNFVAGLGHPLAPGAPPPSTQAVTVVKASDGSAYTGLTSAFIDGKRYLYAANFARGRVDVFDNAFKPVNLSKGQVVQNSSERGNGNSAQKSFLDEKLPNSYVPFNVQAIGNDIVVTYVLHEEGSPFESDGPGLGFVDIYSSTGELLVRLEHGDWLNAPWGVALAPPDFGRFSHDLLIAQFAGGGDTQSSGFIAAYDLSTGKFDGLLQDASGKPLAVNGIWAISSGNVSPANNDAAAAPAAELYFTAGPNHGSEGLFGYLTAVSAELTEGNNQ